MPTVTYSPPCYILSRPGTGTRDGGGLWAGGGGEGEVVSELGKL